MATPPLATVAELSSPSYNVLSVLVYVQLQRVVFLGLCAVTTYRLSPSTSSSNVPMVRPALHADHTWTYYLPGLACSYGLCCLSRFYLQLHAQSFLVCVHLRVLLPCLSVCVCVCVCNRMFSELHAD